MLHTETKMYRYYLFLILVLARCTNQATIFIPTPSVLSIPGIDEQPVVLPTDPNIESSKSNEMINKTDANLTYQAPLFIPAPSILPIPGIDEQPVVLPIDPNIESSKSNEMINKTDASLTYQAPLFIPVPSVLPSPGIDEQSVVLSIDPNSESSKSNEMINNTDASLTYQAALFIPAPSVLPSPGIDEQPVVLPIDPNSESSKSNEMINKTEVSLIHIEEEAKERAKKIDCGRYRYLGDTGNCEDCYGLCRDKNNQDECYELCQLVYYKTYEWKDKEAMPEKNGIASIANTIISTCALVIGLCAIGLWSRHRAGEENEGNSRKNLNLHTETNLQLNASQEVDPAVIVEDPSRAQRVNLI